MACMSLTLVRLSFLFQPMVSYEKIFRFAFQEVPVEQAAEGVPTLDHFLEAGSEGEPGLGSVHKRW